MYSKNNFQNTKQNQNFNKDGDFKSSNFQSNQIENLNYGDKFGLMTDSILTPNCEIVPFNNFLRIILTSTKLPEHNNIFEFKNFKFLLVTRDMESIQNKYNNPDIQYLSLFKNLGISKEHCIFENFQNELYLGDLNSANGSYRKLETNENLILYPKTIFIFLTLSFMVEKIYKIGNNICMDIIIVGEEITAFRINVNGGQIFEISTTSSDNYLKDLLLNICKNKFQNDSNYFGNFPRITFNKENQAFYLLNENNLVDDVLVKLDNTQPIAETEKYNHYLIVKHGDKFNFGLEYFIEVSFIENQTVNYPCVCELLNSEKVPCFNNLHLICTICYHKQTCKFCIEEPSCYCSSYGNIDKELFSSCFNSQHYICNQCFSGNICMFCEQNN